MTVFEIADTIEELLFALSFSNLDDDPDMSLRANRAIVELRRPATLAELAALREVTLEAIDAIAAGN